MKIKQKHWTAIHDCSCEHYVNVCRGHFSDGQHCSCTKNNLNKSLYKNIYDDSVSCIKNWTACYTVMKEFVSKHNNNMNWFVYTGDAFLYTSQQCDVTFVECDINAPVWKHNCLVHCLQTILSFRTNINI